MKEEELLNKMPRTYRDINWKTYLLLQENIMIDQPDNVDDEDFQLYQTYCVLSILCNIPLSDLDKLPFPTMLKLMDGLKFLDAEIVITESPYNLKDLETLTFKDFQSLIKMVQDPYSNMEDILSIIVTDLTTQQINQLSIFEVMQVMGKLTKSLRKSLLRSQRFLVWKIIVKTLKMKMIHLVSWMTFWKTKKNNINNCTDGSSLG